MTSILYIVLVYLFLALLSIGCTKTEPEPACVMVEVVGQDPCREGWIILKIVQDKAPARNTSGNFVGQLESGFVTTDNLPKAYQEAGRQVALRLELNGRYSPVCAAVHIMYPAVTVNRICTAGA